MKKRIIFVDDESRILYGLRRTFRSMRNEWKMSFAKSGHEALDILSRETFDLIVTDINMPGINGIELLKEITRLYPKTARFVLSGRNEKETLLRSENFVHQYISKPCDAETLKYVLKRTFTLHDLLVNDKFEKLLSEIRSLPSLPSLYNDILKTFESPKASLNEIGKLISQDISLSAKVLQVANTIRYQLRQQITNPIHATVQLGIEIVKNLVMLNQVLLHFDVSKLRNLSINELWNHSVVVGTYARNIIKAENIGLEVEDYAFGAGLLHDVGKLIIATNFPEEYMFALTLAKKEGMAIFEAEKEIFNTTHTKVGGYLLGLWGLPDTIIDTVIFHHNPAKNISKNSDVVTAVHVADYLEHESHAKERIETAHKVDSTFLAELGLTERLLLWRDICHKEIFTKGDEK